MAEPIPFPTEETSGAAEPAARERLLEAAVRLLVGAGGAPVSTRAVCAAAGVRAPTLYHHFGDKEGLLDAALAHGFEQWRARGPQLTLAEDPVDGVRREWDAHVAFGLARPGLYVLMYGSPAPEHHPAAAERAQEPLLTALQRAAAAGRLRSTPETAARMLGAAVVGVTLTLLAQQEPTPADDLSARTRDALIAAVSLPEADDVEPSVVSPLIVRAVALREAVEAGAPGLTRNEASLLRDWLERIAQHPTAD